MNFRQIDPWNRGNSPASGSNSNTVIMVLLGGYSPVQPGVWDMSPPAPSGNRSTRLEPDIGAIMKRLCAAFILIAALSAPALKCEGASNTLADAIKLYDAGQYTKALPLLDQAEKEHPTDERIRYYRANAFAGTKDFANAVKEYNACVRLAPKSPSAKLARMALLNFAGDQPVDDTPPTDQSEQKHNRAMVSAIKSIKQQTDQATGNQNSMSGGEYSSGGYERHLNGGHSRRHDMFKMPTYHPYVGMRNYLDGEHSAQLERSASSLEHLLDAGPNMDGVSLKPEGTNLYIRNYESPKSIFIKPILQKGLTASQDKLILDDLPPPKPSKQSTK